MWAILVIFKNISYGQMGVTNSLRVYELFEGKIVYDPDTKELFRKACERLKTFTQEDLYELMDFVALLRKSNFGFATVTNLSDMQPLQI